MRATAGWSPPKRFLREGGSVIRRLNRNDDEAGNDLTALALAGVPIFAGSVTSSSEVRKRMIAEAAFRLFPRGLEGCAPLAGRSGYAVAESRTAIVSEQVLLRVGGGVPAAR